VAIPRRASIIFIQCHGLGYGDLSCYGQTNFQTPNLDQLAANGIRFTHYTPGDTNPAALTSALLNGTGTPSGGLTVAQTLKNLGYHTGMIGEWPLSVEPWKLGFDDFAGFLNPDEGTNYYADSFWRYTPKMFYNTISNSWTDWQPGDAPNNGGRELIFQNSGGQKVRYLPDFMLAGWMQNFVRSHQPDRYNGFDPFFLLVNLPAPRTATPGKDDFPVPSDAPYTDEPWPQAAKNRAALLTHLDGDIAALIEVLNQLGMTNNVAIFLTSGNVPEKFADPRLNFFRSAADLQNPQTNDWSAPMIVYWPGEVPAGQVSDYKWSARDFLPTAAQIGLCPAPENIEGQSILPLLLGRKMPDSP
jgi:arylsulfatase A-like enzyme